MKRKITTIKRMVSFGLILVMTLTGMNVYAAELGVNTDDIIDEQESATSITYNVETGEITYGADQMGDLSDTSSYAIQYDEYGTNPLYDGIIGIDNRVQITNTTESPYCNICYLEILFPDLFHTSGSGVLVYSDVLLTAGHCVYSSEHGGWALNVTVTPAKSGKDSKPLGSTYAMNLTCNEGWTVNNDHRWDWAILDLKKGFNTSQPFGYYDNYYDQLGTSVTAIGYPGDHQYYMYADTNSITYADEKFFVALCDVHEGESGGALIDVRSGYLIGVISSGAEVTPGEEYANYFVRLNPDLCSRIKAHFD